MRKSRIAWNITINIVYKGYWISSKYESEVYTFKINRSRNQNRNMFLSLWQKGLFQVRISLLHKHFGVYKSFFILDLRNLILSKRWIAWNIMINNTYERYWISCKYECEIYTFKINRSRNQNRNMFFSLWQKGLFQVRISILHKHFGVCKSVFILYLPN